MKRLLKSIPLVLIFLLIPTSVSAESPYTTWTMGPGGYFTMTQDAYTPVAEMDLPLTGAEDMFIAPDGALYIADTGNGRIVKLNNFEIVATFGEGTLSGPSSIYVDEDGTMYVADAKLNEVIIIDALGNVVKEIGRPTEPLFGKNREFLPRKIAVDKRKNLYVISEGSVDGIVQLNTNGNFIGYFGANTATMSFEMTLRRLFLTEEQLQQFVKNEAASPSNLTIDHQAMAYTITAGTSESKSIRKFTVAGKNIYEDVIGSTTFRDIDVSEDGLVLAVDAEGGIYEYDLSGALLFWFKAQDTGDQRLGTLRNPTSVERSGEFIYVLDKDKNVVVVYQTTAFARMVHDGVRLYMEGFYTEAKPYFEEVLKANGSFILAYQAIADGYFKERDYPAALEYYRYGEDRDGYSQAYWELRNQVLQKWLSTAILGIAGVWAASSVVGRLEKRRRWFDPLRKWLKDLQNVKLIDDFIFMFRFIGQPMDSFYYIKKDLRGSLRFAGIIYVWVVAVRLLTLYLTGFVFNPYTNVADIRVGNEIVMVAPLILIWNAANYLVSTISDGEGRVRNVIIGSAYSLFPYALFAFPIALLSRVLTTNEAFIYSFSMNIVYFWTGLILFFMVKEIHNYEFMETVRNVLVTLFTMAMFVLTGYILYILFSQFFDFITAILQELRLRG
jgi:DNA-binding beta-propeller fold protein YncE